MSFAGVLLLVLVALTVVFVAYRVISARQAERYVKAASAERDRLVRWAGECSPAQLDKDLLKLPVKRGRLTPRARLYIRNRLWPDLGRRIASQAVKQWCKTAPRKSGEVFAVHAYMDDFGLSEVIADAEVYYKLPRGLRDWMNTLNSASHLSTDIRAAFAGHIQQAGAECAIEKVGDVDRPVKADIYALKSNHTSIHDKTPPPPLPGSVSLKDQWSAYRRWLEQNAPDNAASLNPGATDEQLERLERETETSLTEAFREFYSLHDGQPWESGWVFPDGQWMPVEQVLQAWRQSKQALGSDWQSGWIPFVFDGGASYLVSDQNRGGELICLWFEGDSPEVVATGIAAWLTELNACIGRDCIRYEPDAEKPVMLD